MLVFCWLVAFVCLNFEYFPGQFLQRRIRELVQCSLDALQCRVWQRFAAAVDIDTSRCEQRFCEVSDYEMVSCVFAITKDLPIAAGDHEPALSTPMPGPTCRQSLFWIGSTDAIHALDLRLARRLVLHQIIDFGVGRIAWQLRIRDPDIAFGFPHGQSSVSDMPGPDHPIEGWRISLRR